MENFILYIIKANLFAAICICLVYLIARLVRMKYSSLWKYYTWLFISIFLMIPFGLYRSAAVVNVEVPYQREAAETTPAIANSEPIDDMDTSTISGLNEEAGDNAESTSIKERFLTLTITDVTRIGMYTWIGIVIVIAFMRFLMYAISSYLFKRWALPCRNRLYIQLYYQIRKENGLKVMPKLMTSTRITSPALVGLLRPVLYLPQQEYTIDELKLIFKHELCHYKHKDLWYKLWLLIISTIYWFNPFLYFMRREADKDIEYICDSYVIKACTRRECSIYHRLLLKTAENHMRVHYVSASLNDDMTAFKERILYMVNLRRLKKGRVFAILFIALLVASNLLVGCSVKKAKETDDSGKDLTIEKSNDTDINNGDQQSSDHSGREDEGKEDNQPGTETASASDDQAVDESKPNDTDVDKSGDYLGDIASPNPPKDASYRIHNVLTADEAIVVYITNLDNANIKFRVTKAQQNSVESENRTDAYTESTIFNEHIAHYNGDGYYEYIGTAYHLYFEYDEGMAASAGDYSVTIYGLDGVFDSSQYDGGVYDNGMNGTTFIMGLPFAG